MKTRQIILSALMLGTVSVTTLSGCNSGTLWKPEVAEAMQELVGEVLPYPNISLDIEPVADIGVDNVTAKFAVTRSADSLEAAQQYLQTLLNQGYVENTARNQSSRTSFYRVAQKGSGDDLKYVRIFGGAINKNFGVYSNDFTSGFAIQAYGRDDGGSEIIGYRDGMLYSDMRNAEFISNPPTTGRQINMLIPVEFKDDPNRLDDFGYDFDLLPGGEARMLDYIEKGFNGDPSDTNWESLTSFYEKSSFGEIEVSAKIPFLGNDAEGNPLKTFYVDMTIPELIDSHINKHGGGTGGHVVFEILDLLFRYLFEEVYEMDEDAYNDALAEFDLDGDMIVDNVWFINPYVAHPTDNDPGLTGLTSAQREAYDDVFWAYTHHNFFVNARPTRWTGFYTFAWMSYDFMFNPGMYINDQLHDWTDDEIASGVAKVDAHTLIHEHGHVLSMPDFYTYDSGDWGPLGGLDMMDNNVGDHNMWSKMNYGWAKPIVVREPTTITIHPSQLSGEAIILPGVGKWDNTLLDEYLMLEFYTPTGLNEADSLHKFEGVYPQMFTESGVKVTHFDARLGVFQYNENTQTDVFQSYTDFLGSTGVMGSVKIVADNTASRSGTTYLNKNVVPNVTEKPRLAHLLESSGQNTLKLGRVASNAALFTDATGRNTFGKSGGPFANWYMNDGEKFGWTFTIDEMSEEAVTITFQYA